MSEIQPALTAEEWRHTRTTWSVNGREAFAEVHHEPQQAIRVIVVAPDGFPKRNGDGLSSIPDDRCHAIAALCLHDQPFGFTQEEQEALDEFELWAWVFKSRKRAVLRSLSAKIAALLPPTP